MIPQPILSPWFSRSSWKTAASRPLSGLYAGTIRGRPEPGKFPGRARLTAWAASRASLADRREKLDEVCAAILPRNRPAQCQNWADILRADRTARRRLIRPPVITIAP